MAISMARGMVFLVVVEKEVSKYVHGVHGGCKVLDLWWLQAKELPFGGGKRDTKAFDPMLQVVTC
jgi:hypothetical protein